MYWTIFAIESPPASNDPISAVLVLQIVFCFFIRLQCVVAWHLELAAEVAGELFLEQLRSRAARKLGGEGSLTQTN